MNAYELIYILCIFGLIALLFSKFWNVLNMGRKMGIDLQIMVFVGSIILYVVALSITMLDYAELLYTTVTRLATFGISLMTILFIGEVILHFKSLVANRETHYSNREK